MLQVDARRHTRRLCCGRLCPRCQGQQGGLPGEAEGDRQAVRWSLRRSCLPGRTPGGSVQCELPGCYLWAAWALPQGQGCTSTWLTMCHARSWASAARRCSLGSCNLGVHAVPVQPLPACCFGYRLLQIPKSYHALPAATSHNLRPELLLPVHQMYSCSGCSKLPSVTSVLGPCRSQV